MTLRKKIKNNKIFNFGSDNIFSVKDIIQKIIDLSGKSLKIEKVADEREFEIDIQFSSWKKANRLLGWKAKFTLDEGLKKTLDWYQSFFKRTL